MTIQEISDLLDEKLKPIETRLGAIESDIKIIKEDIRKILTFVPVGNEDIEDTLKKQRKRVA